jgi:formylglycine-generating enzyme required for sulfatase activity
MGNQMGNQLEGNLTWLDINDAGCRIDSVSDGYVPLSGFENHPVVEVSWYGAVAYCDWLTTKTDQTYRLPTDAEWEKAARGDASKNSAFGHQRRFPWGDGIDSSNANYYDSGDPFDTRTTPIGYYDGTTHGGFFTNDNASPYGACDMAGNVSEWCSDWYNASYYSTSPITDPLGPLTGNTHSIRGGNCENLTKSLRSASRGIGCYPNSTYHFVGFRCVREY